MSMQLPLALSLFLLVVCAQAQDRPATPPKTSFSRWSLGVTIGPAVPTGHFAMMKSPQFVPVTIYTGFSAELNGSYRFCRSFGATVVMNGQENHGGALINGPNPSGNNLLPGGFQDHSWKIGRILGGAVYTTRLQKRGGPDLLLRLLGGAEKTRSADFEGYETFGNRAPESKASYPGYSLPWAFSYEADAGLQWNLHGGIALTGYAGYNGGNPSWQGTKLSTSTIAIRAGITYCIEKRPR